MGAIAGVMPRDGTVDREELTGMLAGLRDAMGRRGPVEGGMAVAYDASIGLAHRAGEGPGGESVLQPLTNESGTLWLVADGEPSNAADLRLELIGAGHRFCSACGSEVILHLYEQDGPHALARLAGAFAFALWDRTQRQLVLGRDRAGERPLYVAEEAGVLRFASEARALAAEPGITPAGAAAFLTLGYLPEPLTVAPAVRALRPGTILRARGGRSRRESFWEDAAGGASGELQDDRLRVGRVLREAIQDAVAGEEGVGIALAGELSDTALLALTSPVVGRGLRTHTFVYESAASGARVNRRWRLAAEHARALAAWFRSEHREHHVGPEPMAGAFSAAADADQPSIGAPLAHLLAAHVAMSGDRLLLSAVGGEELIGVPRGAWLPWVWRAGRFGVTRAPARAVVGLFGRLRPFGGAAAVADALARPDALVAAHLGAHAVVVPRTLSGLLRPEVLEDARATFDLAGYVRGLIDTPLGPPTVVVSPSARAAAMRVVSAIERAGPLTSGRLRDAEHAAAVVGLGFRAPYLDHRLVEWVCGPNSRGHTADAIVRELLRASVPTAFRRRMVPAPPPPLADWLRAELRPLVEEHLFGDDPEGYFVAAGVEALWKRFLAGGAPAAPVWAIAILRAWIGAWRTRRRQGAGTGRRAAA